MFNIGPQEIIIILVVALIFFGPSKMPEIGRALGKGLRELKRSSQDIIDSVSGADDDTEPTKGSDDNVTDSNNRTK